MRLFLRRFHAARQNVEEKRCVIRLRALRGIGQTTRAHVLTSSPARCNACGWALISRPLATYERACFIRYHFNTATLHSTNVKYWVLLRVPCAPHGLRVVCFKGRVQTLPPLPDLHRPAQQFIFNELDRFFHTRERTQFDASVRMSATVSVFAFACWENTHVPIRHTNSIALRWALLQSRHCRLTHLTRGRSHGSRRHILIC